MGSFLSQCIDRAVSHPDFRGDFLGQTTTVCWGAGVDSTAMLVLMQGMGWVPDAITFADTGGEKPETYGFIPQMEGWLLDHGMPAVTHCRYTPQPETHARYRAAAIATADRLGIALGDREADRLAGLFGNSVANETLPGLAFAMKSCSLKWKVEAQEPQRCVLQPLVDAWQRGERVVKLIGYDATEDHRTYAAGNLSIGSGPGIPSYKDRYDTRYLLRMAGMDRDDCCRLIAEAGLPVPVKSACFFCPAMSKIEIARLRTSSPDLYALAIEMERTYRAGRHFRGDGVFSVKAKHKTTGETWKGDIRAESAAEARAIFRTNMRDTGRPYQWKLAAHSAVAGLGGRSTWQELEAAQTEGAG